MTVDTQGLERAATQNRENQLRFLFNVIARHWKLILLFCVLAMIVYALLALFYYDALGMFGAVPRDRYPYEAQVQVAIRETPLDTEVLEEIAADPIVKTAPSNLVQRTNPGELAYDIAKGLVQEGLLTGAVPGRLLTDDELSQLAGPIQAGLSLSPDDTAGTVTLAVRGRDPEEARHIADFAARAFIRHNQEDLSRIERETYQLVQAELTEASRRLDAAENAEWEFRRDLGFRTFDDLEADMHRMNSEIRQSETAAEKMKTRLAQIEDELRENNQRLPNALAQMDDAVIQGLLTELNELLQKKFTMSVVYTEEFPEMQMLQAEIREKQQAILDAARQLEGAAVSGTDVWTRGQVLRQQYAQLQLDLASEQVRSETLQDMLDDLIQRWPALMEQRPEYMALVSEAENQRKAFNWLVDKKTEIEDAMRRGTGPIEREGSVSEPRLVTAEGVNHVINFIAAAIVGIILGVMAAVLIEMNDTSIRTVEDITEYVNLEVIGTIPEMQFGRSRTRKRRGNFVAIKEESEVDACVVTQHDPKSPISEAYRTLRTNFQLATIQKRPKSILVTSAVPGEGKTTTAVNMGVTFADSGFKVLLVDTDLRRPHVHHVLKMQRGPGLADVLRAGTDYQPHIRPTRIKNLWIISSGHVPPNPSELIGSQRMRTVMQNMSTQFDLVICDAPSVLVVTDPVLLATYVDSVVLVVSADNARRDTIMRAKKHMETAQANLAGVVLNGLETSRRHYYYYYYYYDDSETERRKGRFIHI